MVSEHERIQAGEPAKVLVPLPARPPPVTAVRGTILCASVVGLHQVGLRERYLAELPEPLHADIMGLTAGEWAPVALAHAHYSVLERLQLPASTVAAMTEHLTSRLRTTLLSKLFSVARVFGATPLTALAHYPKTWARLFQGGAVALTQLGPGQVRVQLVGLPLLEIPFFAAGVRALQERSCAGLATRVQVSRIRSARPSECLFDVTWS